MNKISFDKYQGTGNDFIIISELSSVTKENIQFLCDRKFGIGADGLILMKKQSDQDFDMFYYNADGSQSFCGNGSRCAVMYAYKQGWIENECSFNSNDGVHYAKIIDDKVHLQMHDVSEIINNNGEFIIQTGSPHYISYTPLLNDIDIISAAHKIRYSDQFAENGINVNFLSQQAGELSIRTYERGVEDETLSCGTGVTAAAIAHYLKSENTQRHHNQKLSTKGGLLEVRFDYVDGVFRNVYLIGPAVFVFKGDISL